MKYIYTGDSTAVKAFETHEGNDELSQLVNLGKLFEIYTSYKMFDLSSYGKPNNWLARSVRESNVGRIPVFWLYTDPLQKQQRNLESPEAGAPAGAITGPGGSISY
mgnify:CR=1 FL=1